MENRKIIVAVTAIAALLLLFAGVGYAVFSGNARTYNEGNEETLAYMTAAPSDFSPFATEAADVIFDTYTYDCEVYSVDATITDSTTFEASKTAHGTLYTKTGSGAYEAIATYDAEKAPFYTMSKTSKFVPVTYADAAAYNAAVAALVDGEHIYKYNGSAFTVSESDPYDADAKYFLDTELTVSNPVKAYAFKSAPTTTIMDVYTAYLLGSKTITIDNQTGADITSIDVNVKAFDNAGNANNIGSTDFVYVFEFKNGSNDAVYAVFDGSTNDKDVKGIAVTGLTDGATAVLDVKLYIAYVANVFVPTNYIGPATTTATALPYIVPATLPVDLSETDFAFNFTETAPEP